jgi:hypothetical protein
MVRYARPNGGRVEFGADAVAALMKLRQLDDGAPEGGGVLLGRLILTPKTLSLMKSRSPVPTISELVTGSDVLPRLHSPVLMPHGVSRRELGSIWEIGTATRRITLLHRVWIAVIGIEF